MHFSNAWLNQYPVFLMLNKVRLSSIRYPELSTIYMQIIKNNCHFKTQIYSGGGDMDF
jgi:hypothetical protein